MNERGSRSVTTTEKKKMSFGTKALIGVAALFLLFLILTNVNTWS